MDNRHTTIGDITAFHGVFVTEIRRRQWKGFLKNKEVIDQFSFEEAIDKIRIFLLPVIESIRFQIPFDKVWNHLTCCWENMASSKQEKSTEEVL